MKRFISRITLVALCATTCSTVVYPIHPAAKTGLIVAAAGAAVTTGCVAAFRAWNKWYGQQYRANDEALNYVNASLPVLTSDRDNKPSFCRLQGADREARKAYYAQQNGQNKANLEDNDYAALNKTIAEKHDERARLEKALDPHRNFIVVGGLCALAGLWSIWAGIADYCTFRTQ